MKNFNVTGLCTPEEDYMVDISGKMEQIMKMINEQCYFLIQHERCYGKTTILNEIKKRLEHEFICIKLDFEELGNEIFESSEKFCSVFIKSIVTALEFTSAEKVYINQWTDYNINNIFDLGNHITKMCKDRKIVLMIDNAAMVCNNSRFLDFLGMLREKFILRKTDKSYTFHSVIFSVMYDIKNIKLENSRHAPWNSI